MTKDNNNNKQIVVVGAGHVGLIAGACLADWGHHVTCVDVDRDRIKLLNQGGVPIYEPGLYEIVARTVGAGRLSFSTHMETALKACDAAFIAVGTPQGPDGEADLSYVFASARQIAQAINPRAVIATKSTVPVGTGDVIERLVREARPNARIAVASNPEFLREGAAVMDFLAPDRVVIGAEDARAAAILKAIYHPIAARGLPVVVTRRRSAELIKYASNAFLATKIAFINEIADLCEAVDADVSDIARGMGLDRRIGPHFLQAGPGYGGSCFPKDTIALMRTAQEHGVDLKIVEHTIASNAARKRRMVMKVKAHLDGSLRDKRVAVLGLTFKADTDDVRESPAIPLIEMLQRSGADVCAHDPQGMEQAKTVLSDVAFFADPYECARQADAVVLMTEWESLKRLDLTRLAAVMRRPVLVDLRGMYDPKAAAAHGFAVETIGRAGIGLPATGGSRPAYFLPAVVTANGHGNGKLAAAYGGLQLGLRDGEEPRPDGAQ